MITRLISQQFSKIKTSQILSKSYEELVNLVSKRYSNPQFKHNNTAALYQIQHHHQIINPGDYVLDVGAGPHFRWTDLALMLAQNSQFTHKVVSNDSRSVGISRPSQVFVRGDFLEEPVRTKIALSLGQNQFDTVLSDVSPNFTGDMEEDGFNMMQIIHELMFFNSTFLRKGGNMVCKVIHSTSTDLFKERASLFFHQFFTFKPSVIRTNSPVYFLIFKGFGINHNLEAIQTFLRKYRGSPKNKVQIVEEYRNKYDWNPVKVLQQRAKQDFLNLRMQGKSIRDIQIIFKDDPFIKIGPISKSIQKIQKAKQKGDDLALKKGIHELSSGKLFKQEAQVPNSREEWITFFEDLQNQVKQKRAKKQQKAVQNLQPLGDNEVYMKGNIKSQQQPNNYLYIQQDLLGQYGLQHEQRFYEKQITKINKILKKEGRQPLKQTRNKKIDLKEVFGWRGDDQEPQKELREMAQTFKTISDQDYYQMEKNQFMYEQSQHQTGSTPRNKNKFRNK